MFPMPVTYVLQLIYKTSVKKKQFFQTGALAYTYEILFKLHGDIISITNNLGQKTINCTKGEIFCECY